MNSPYNMVVNIVNVESPFEDDVKADGLDQINKLVKSILIRNDFEFFIPVFAILSSYEIFKFSKFKKLVWKILQCKIFIYFGRIKHSTSLSITFRGRMSQLDQSSEWFNDRWFSYWRPKSHPIETCKVSYWIQRIPWDDLSFFHYLTEFLETLGIKPRRGMPNSARCLAILKTMLIINMKKSWSITSSLPETQISPKHKPWTQRLNWTNGVPKWPQKVALSKKWNWHFISLVVMLNIHSSNWKTLWRAKPTVNPSLSK